MSLPALPGSLVDGAIVVATFTPSPLPPAKTQAVMNVVDPSNGWIFEQGAIEVDATIEWELDGVEDIRTTALRWCEYAVYVVVDDSRFVGVGVWLSALDVRETH